MAVGSSWAMLPIGHSHEPLLFKGTVGDNSRRSPPAGPYLALLPDNKPLCAFYFFFGDINMDAMEISCKRVLTFLKRRTSAQINLVRIKCAHTLSYQFMLSLVLAQETTPCFFHSSYQEGMFFFFCFLFSGCKLCHALQRLWLRCEWWAFRPKRQP